MNLGGTIRLNPLGFCIVIGAFLLLTFYAFSGTNSSNAIKDELSSSDVNLKSLLTAAIEVAEKGGSAIKAVRLEVDDVNVKSKGKTKEGVDDPVTNADFKSHCIMYHTLKNKFPKIKVISEEHPEHSCSNIDKLNADVVGLVGTNDLPDVFVPSEDITVWIDPLDATKEFTENLVHYVTTMVCVAVKGVPVIGVIHAPFGIAKTTWAWAGQGSSTDINSDVIQARQGEIKDAIVLVSRSHAGKVKNVTANIFGPKTRVISAAGAGYKVLELLKGEASVYLHVTAIKKWDVCAGNAIMKAVGGHMTDLQGNILDYSATANALNEKGLLVTLNDPKEYLKGLSNVKL